jgi:hypothetical protein
VVHAFTTGPPVPEIAMSRISGPSKAFRESVDTIARAKRLGPRNQSSYCGFSVHETLFSHQVKAAQGTSHYKEGDSVEGYWTLALQDTVIFKLSRASFKSSPSP